MNYLIQDTQRTSKARVKQEEEADKRIVVKEEQEICKMNVGTKEKSSKQGQTRVEDLTIYIFMVSRLLNNIRET